MSSAWSPLHCGLIVESDIKRSGPKRGAGQNQNVAWTDGGTQEAR
jgi:hypothetical protein